MKSADFYDADYFERGMETEKSSCLTNYTWRPDLSFPLAMGIIDLVGLRTGEPVLDYGCAKGYLVRALRWLHREAFGTDFSSYAISQAPDDIKAYVKLNDGITIPWNIKFHLTIAKDVLEHQDEDYLSRLLSNLRSCSDEILVIVPLGDGRDHIIPEYAREISHVQKQPIDWWIACLEHADFRLVKAYFEWPGIKPQWRHYPQGHGIIHAA